MKLLLVAGIYPPDVGGPATFLPQFAEFCRAHGHQVRVLTLSDNHGSKGLPSPWKVIRILRHLPLPLRFVIATLLVCLHSVKNYKIFANGLHEECGLAIWLSRGKGVAKIVGDPIWERARNKSTTNLDIDSFNSSTSKNWFIVNQRRLLKFGLNQFGTVITPSQQLQDLVRMWKVTSNLQLIPNGVSSKYQIKPEKYIDVITVCRLVAWKNVDLLIKAANEYNFSLCIVGDGPELDTLITAAKGNTKIDFRGRLPQGEVDKLLMASRIFALISDYEGLSFSLLQAMSFGLPVVVSNSSGNADVVKKSKNGIIVDPRTHGQLGLAILGLLKNISRIDKLSKKSSDSIRNFYSIEKCLEKTLETLSTR